MHLFIFSSSSSPPIFTFNDGIARFRLADGLAALYSRGGSFFILFYFILFFWVMMVVARCKMETDYVEKDVLFSSALAAFATFWSTNTFIIIII